MEPFDVPPRGEVEVEYEVTPTDPGPFKCEPWVSFYDRGYQELEMSVTGTGIAPKAAARGPTTR
jgi:hypothetical protein